MSDSIMDSMDSMLERALSQMERASSDIEAAHKSGKELIKILCAPGTKRGDIIKIIPAGMDEDCPEEDKMPGKVIAVHGMTGIDPETMQMHRMCEAIVALLKPGDITTEEDFASLYSEDPSEEEQDAAVKALFDATPEELGEAAVAQAQEEAPDPNVCSCGANREMCARNQNVFGGHLNE